MVLNIMQDAWLLKNYSVLIYCVLGSDILASGRDIIRVSNNQ